MTKPTDFFDLFQPTPPAQPPVPVVPEPEPQPEVAAEVPSLFAGVLDDVVSEVIEGAPEVEAQDSGWADDLEPNTPPPEPELPNIEAPEDLAVLPEVMMPVVVPEPEQALVHAVVEEAPTRSVVNEVPVEQEPEPTPGVRIDDLPAPVRGATSRARWIWGAVAIATIAAAGTALHIYRESPKEASPTPKTAAQVVAPTPAPVSPPVELTVEATPEPAVEEAPPAEPKPQVKAMDPPIAATPSAPKAVKPKPAPKVAPKPEREREPKREWQDDAMNQLDDIEKRL